MNVEKTSFQRRDVLKMATTIPLVAIAGCTGVLADDEPPDYADVTPRDGANDSDGVFFVHIDAEWLRAFDAVEELPYSETLPDALDIDIHPDTPPIDVDPLLAYPTAGFVAGALSIGFGLVPYGFGDMILDGVFEEVSPDETDDDQEEEPAVDGTVRIDSMLIVDGVGIFRGEFDARSIVAATRDFEPSSERGGFDLYEGTDDGFLGTDGLAFAVRDGVLVTLFDGDASLERVLETIAGDAERLGDTDDGGWALAEAGHGHVTLGAWGVEPEPAVAGNHEREFIHTEDVLEDADGFVSSLTLGPDEGVGTLAAVYPPDETPQRAAFENQIGTSVSSRNIDIEDSSVSITGIWRVPDEDTDG